MILNLLLLISLTSCVSGSFVVNVTQTSYQAEEDQDITLEWTFTTRTSTSLKSINVHCEVYAHNKPSVLFHLHEGVEDPKLQNNKFAGRVRCDIDVLRGQLRLNMSRLRIDDSGLYVCKVLTSDGTGSSKSYLNVSGSFVVNVTQTSYQAEEDQDITLEWTFTTRTSTSSRSINIYCELLTDIALFHLHEGVEVPESQDEQFAGRVQFDKDVLREGRLRLNVSRLRINDSGLFKCDMLTGDGQGSRTCHLNVTAAKDQPEPERPEDTSPPQAESLGRISLYVGLTAAAVVLYAGLCFTYRRCFMRKETLMFSLVSQRNNPSGPSGLGLEDPPLNESLELRVL